MLSACQKSVNEEYGKHPYFFKRFGSQNEEAAVFINDCIGNKIYVSAYVATNTDEFIDTYQYSEYGIVLQNGREVSSYGVATGYRFEDGSYAVGKLYINDLAKYNADGSLVGRYQNSGNMDYFHGTPIVLSNKHVAFGLANGFGAYSSHNYIYELDETMKFYTVHEVLESNALGHVIRMEIDRIEGNDYYCSGSMIPSPWQFSDKHRTFVARFNFSNPANNFVKIVSPSDINLDDNMVAKANLSDGGLVQLISPGFFLIGPRADLGGKFFELVRWDKERNLIWRNKFGLGFNITTPTRITINEKGELLVVGQVKNGATDPAFPFIMKIDASGNEIFHRVYPEIFDGGINYGYEASNGDFYFAGVIQLFGENVLAHDGFILKTDAKGNFK
ncbi:MAG: hypothetical protein GC180_03755 [Bacteroidetes bacterium]|nr:hypothetical protein [Bacteroidota bacterium]